jgi:hypothetical protein
MDSKRPLTPDVINRIDQQLLKNNPVTWSTRIHLALYYGLAFALIVFVLSFIAPDDPRAGSTIYNWIILLSIVSLLAFIFWMIYLLRFNVFKRFGKWGSADTVKTFILYFLVILLIVSLPYIPPIVQSIRANAAYKSNELANDINNMNIRLCLLERDSINTRFARDTFMLKDSVKGSIMRNQSYDENSGNQDYNFYFIDTATLNNKLAFADSVRKLNDSVYVVFECPEFTFINCYPVNENSATKVLGSMDLFRRALQYRQTIDTGKTRKELAAFFSKYRRRSDSDTLMVTYDYINGRHESGHMERVGDKYDLYYVNGALGNIAEKKYRWDSYTIAAASRSAYYTTLVLALLVLIYRHTTRRTFFLSLLSAVVLTILTGLFLAMSASSDSGFYTWMIVYFIVFALVASTIINSEHRNVISGIGLNLLVFITAFMPIIATAAYYNYLHNKYELRDDFGMYDRIFKYEALHFIMAEIGGILLLLVLLATLYQRAYRKWYSLPEQ